MTDYLTPVFVDLVPDELQSNKIYVSIRYRTTVHLCASGCGNKVVLPLSPAEWKLCFDGETVSLNPSVGNWEYPCRSHYWIRRNRVEWAPSMNAHRIEARRRQDQSDLDRYFADRAHPEVEKSAPATQIPLSAKIRRFFGRP